MYMGYFQELYMLLMKYIMNYLSESVIMSQHKFSKFDIYQVY